MVSTIEMIESLAVPGNLTLLMVGLLVLSIGWPTQSAAQALQSQAAFETAIRDKSTSPYIVLITVIDDRSGQVSTGCNSANLLRGAIYYEKRGDFGRTVTPEEVEQAALDNTSHVFHFSNQAALNKILPFRYPEACAAIERGSRARVADMTGHVILGPFSEGPSIIRSSCHPPTDPRPSEAGDITIALEVGRDGALKQSKVTESSSSAHWDAEVLAALSVCRFSPRTIDGEPVSEATWMTITMGRRAHW